ncbi:pilus assembly PilX family protein [Halomonas alkaliantarctica]|uniref:pilus assembly PilX family protein n=1 Tax=Halomonas alkaliantarctica TaxID=232346 RepID=UPI0004AA182A|nr:hypothetical protein [Halomonas alkaliantarctica]
MRHRHRHRHRHQEQGVALVVVMGLLASAVVVGAISVQSALVEERLASNYRAATLAQMRAEIAAAQAVASFSELVWGEGVLAIDSEHPNRWEDIISWEELVAHPLTTVLSSACEHNSCLFIPIERDGQPWVMALGAVIAVDSTDGESLLAQSLPVFINVKEGEVSQQTKATVVWH